MKISGYFEILGLKQPREPVLPSHENLDVLSQHDLVVELRNIGVNKRQAFVSLKYPSQQVLLINLHKFDEFQVVFALKISDVVLVLFEGELRFFHKFFVQFAID